MHMLSTGVVRPAGMIEYGGLELAINYCIEIFYFKGGNWVGRILLLFFFFCKEGNYVGRILKFM